MERHGVAPEQVQLEITESMVMQNIDRVIRLLDGRVIDNAVQTNPKEISLVQTLPDGTVIELPEGEPRAREDAVKKFPARA